jgi:hypothetical protein
MAETNSKLNVLISLKSQTTEADRVVAGLKKIGAAAAGAGVAFAVLATRQSLALAGQIVDLAASANVGTQAFQALTAAGLDSGVKMEEVSKAFIVMQKSIQEAVEGNATLGSAFRTLGLSASGLKALAPERQFEMIAKAAKNAADQQAAWNAAMDILGQKNAPKLRQLLDRLAVEGFDKVYESSKKFRISDENLKTLDDASDKLDALITRLKILAAKGVVQIAAVVAPDPNAPRVSRADAATAAAARARAQTQSEKEAPFTFQQGRNRAETAANRAKALAERERALALKEAEKTKQQDALRNSEEEKRRKQYEEAEVAARIVAEQKAAEAAEEKVYEENQKSRERRIRLSAENRAEAERLAKEEAEAVAKARQLESDAADQRLGQGLFAEQLKRSAIENNRYLTKKQKAEQLLPVLAAENKLIDERIQLLETELAKEPDAAARQGIAGRIDSLRQQSATNSSTASLTAPLTQMQELRAGLVDLANSFESIGATLASGVGSALDTVGDQLTASILRAQSLDQAFANIGITIGTQIVAAIVKMGLQWIASRIIMAATDKGIAATSLGVNAGIAAAQTALWTTPATLATIASYGSAAAQAPGSITGALAASKAATALGSFADGGPTGPGGKYQVAGIVHRGENVWSQDDIARWGGMQVVEAMRTMDPSRGYMNGGAVASPITPATPSAATASGASRREPTIILVGDEREKLRYQLNSGDYDARTRYVQNRYRKF